MITLLKNIECYCPRFIGKKDILIAGSKIYKILDSGSLALSSEIADIVDCEGLMAFPGIIDGHVHISGGGGEGGFASRIGKIKAEDLLLFGVTTVVGLLGFDCQTKGLKDLLAAAYELESAGMTAFIYSGSYSVPIVTFTGDIASDMVLVEKVIGAGEIAISDFRSSHPDMRDMLDLATKAYMGGLLSGKAGLVHIHLGDGKSGLDLLSRLIEESDLSAEQFLPTHVNRNIRLFEQGVEYAKNGGNIDLTSGEKEGIAVYDAVELLIKNGVDLASVTISSDANGSSCGGGLNKASSLFEDVIKCILHKNIKPEVVFPLITENVAKRIKKYPQKGTLAKGSDADILILDKEYNIQKLFSLGRLLINEGKLVEKLEEVE
jgi:beta-aspartyl-dipeptidase (metallo-type)